MDHSPHRTEQLKAYSVLTDEVLELGPKSANFDEMVELGDMMATSRPGLVVFVDGPKVSAKLQRWERA